MRSSAIRLDSFSAGSGDKSHASVTALETAFQRGHERGLSDGRETSLDALTATLAEMRGDMTSYEVLAANLRQKALADLMPVLAAVIDLLGGRSNKDRLRDALMGEFRRMNEIAAPRKLLIRCAPDLRPDVEDCLARANFPEVLIEETHDGRLMVDLVADKATITFDPDASIAALRSIIDDIMTED
jgi:hypothetical protein